MPTTRTRRATMRGPVAFALVLCAARPALATDPFEIQVYDGTANAPGVPGIELHVNRVMSGLTEAEAPALPPHHQSHFTLEPSYGLLPWWELGGYFQTTLRGDGGFEFGRRTELTFDLAEWLAVDWRAEQR